MHPFIKTAAILFPLIALPVSAFAKVEKYEFDPEHSSVLIKVNHLGYSNYYLKATEMLGDISFDKDKPENSSVSVTIQSASIDGNNAKLNTHLKGVDFFDTTNFPTITFASTGIKATGANTGQISGMLTIRGITQPAVLNATFNKEGENALTQDYRAGFSATTKIKRSDFGITYALPALGDEVELQIEVEAVRQEKRGWFD
ncbi:MAG: polyisoprenoid-binding protein [Alphaproteobacteria bacterium]|nr:polyisoprenoid-binding protein [Alphaproteobacteria bacterium]